MKAVETVKYLFKKEELSIGTRHQIQAESSGFRLHYEHPNGKLYQGDNIAWLNSLEDESVDLIFADPPYNINKAEWDNFESQEHYI